MKAIETIGTDTEPPWESFGINRVDFRPHWDGDLVNIFTSVEPLDTEFATERLMVECARSIAGWVTGHHERFGSDDRFQIIIGWPKSVREGGRQVIKTGGIFEDLQKIADGQQPIEMRRGWCSGVFPTEPISEQDAPSSGG
jgi:hypothetical protein